MDCIICGKNRDKSRKCNELHQAHNLYNGRLIAICCMCFH